MSIQTLKQQEIVQVAGAGFCSSCNFGPTASGFGASGSYDTPFGTFSGIGGVGPDGIGRTVSYSGIFGSYTNIMGFGPNGFTFQPF